MNGENNGNFISRKSKQWKTSIFNKITKMNQHVGNFPGVTVDITVGKVDEYNDCEIIDLPGLYSHLHIQKMKM